VVCQVRHRHGHAHFVDGHAREHDGAALLLRARVGKHPYIDPVDGAAASTDEGKKTSETADPVTIADLNLLHGLFCTPDVTDWCHAPARVEIFGK